jgi:flagellar hook protein FlgE
MNAGVMGLNVNSSKLATISDNIANSETKGYKRANVEFNSLVLTERPTSYDAGGVRATTTREIDDQGALLSTRSGTDLAISGRGFLPVTDIADVNRGSKELPLKLLRTGSFRPDQNGVLQTGSGLALLGWPRLTDGTFSTVQTDLVPIQVDALSLSAERTQNLDVKLNLDADAVSGTTLPMPIQFYDTLGRSQYVDLLWTKETAANLWRLEVWTQPYRDTDNVIRRAPDSAFQVAFDDSPGGTPGGILSIKEYDRALLAPTDAAVDWSSSTAGVQSYTDVFPPTDPDYEAPVTGGVFGPGGVRSYDWATPANILSSPVDQRWNTTTGVFRYNPSNTVDGDMNIKLGAPGTDSNVVQYSAESQVLSVDKDGSPASSLIGVEIDQNGLMDAVFESGVRQTLYKIPIANVQNPNGMRALDGQAFSLTRESGSVYFYDAGSGPTGALVSSALEESTTDVAEELTQLIKTQRAYSSNAKIIQTVDEMLQETTNLKR